MTWKRENRVLGGLIVEGLHIHSDRNKWCTGFTCDTPVPRGEAQADPMQDTAAQWDPWYNPRILRCLAPQALAGAGVCLVIADLSVILFANEGI